MEKITQNSSRDFSAIFNLVKKQIPFTFVRFSDGEMEVIRNEQFFIGDGKISWRKGSYDYYYPEFDKKEFIPDRDFKFRDDLLVSANYKSSNYIKGIPATHNNAVDDRDLMIRFNDYSVENLTFSDLLINHNFLKFRKNIFPLFFNYQHVFLLGNHRAKPELININWKLVALQDNFFTNYTETLDKSLSTLSKLPFNSLVLSSASSLSNIVGAKLNKIRQDITMIDIGTSLHDLVGMESGIREYHALLLNNSPKNLYKKIRLISQKNHKLKW